MAMYEPREGTGWEEGESVFPDEFRRWRTPLGIVFQNGGYLVVTVSLTGSGLFIIGRVSPEEEHSVPTFEDMKRIEKDFGVRGWQIVGVAPSLSRGGGKCLMARAVQG